MLFTAATAIEEDQISKLINPRKPNSMPDLQVMCHSTEEKKVVCIVLDTLYCARNKANVVGSQ